MTQKAHRTSTDGQARPPVKRTKRHHTFVAILAVFIIGLGTACSPAQEGDTPPQKNESQLAPASQLPARVKSAPPVVQEAYQFAIANPEILERYPCYCGCAAMTHLSNLSCYIQDIGPDGSITFDYHALG